MELNVGNGSNVPSLYVSIAKHANVNAYVCNFRSPCSTGSVSMVAMKLKENEEPLKFYLSSAEIQEFYHLSMTKDGGSIRTKCERMKKRLGSVWANYLVRYRRLQKSDEERGNTEILELSSELFRVLP